jgi:hypothetical protein
MFDSTSLLFGFENSTEITELKQLSENFSSEIKFQMIRHLRLRHVAGPSDLDVASGNDAAVHLKKINIYSTSGPTSASCGCGHSGAASIHFPFQFFIGTQLLNLQLQRQRCSRLERFLEAEENIFVLKAH